MVKVSLVDNRPGAPFWRIAIGPGGETYVSEITESNRPIKLPVAGRIDWFIVELLRADGRMIAEEYLREIVLQDGYQYDYSFTKNQLIKREPVEERTLASYLLVPGFICAAGLLIGIGISSGRKI